MDLPYKSKLIRALATLLRPVIRLCLRHEITNAELAELVRLTYVQVAYERYNLPEIEMTISRAAVLTGLSRKEVGRLREVLEQSDTVVKQSPNKAQRVTHGWLNDAEFTDNNGLPLTLPITHKKGGKETGSFISLVKRYSSDVTYGAILDELNHIGVTEQPNEKTVALVNYAYVPHQDDLEQVRIITTCISDLFDTALHNIDAEASDKRFQRQVVYSHIDESLVEELQETISEKAREVLESLNSTLAVARKKSAATKKSKLKRLGFGMYYFENNSPEPEKTNNRKNENDV